MYATLRSVRVVIVHDYLTQRGGAERVVLALLSAFPGARLVTSVYDPDGSFPEFRDHEIETILPAGMPFARRDPRFVFPLLAFAFSRHRIVDADVIVCSTSGWAHGIATTAPKLVYCHTPARWLYERDDYLMGQPLPVRLAARIADRPLKRWDAAAAASATAYVANSTVVRARIRRIYGLEAELLHPPVMIDVEGRRQPVDVGTDPFLLTVARSRGYKNSAVVEAAADAIGASLVVVGASPGRPTPTTVRVGRVSDAELRWLYANCRALVAASHEDFGLTPIEAMAFGKPVVALRAGGYLDSLVEGVTGLFFDRATAADISHSLKRIDAAEFDSAAIRRHAEEFSPHHFTTSVRALVERTAVVNCD